MLMNDKDKTRIRVQGVTSYAPAIKINYAGNNAQWPVINMTIGSVVLVLNYITKEERDLDIQRLDEDIDKV